MGGASLRRTSQGLKTVFAGLCVQYPIEKQMELDRCMSFKDRACIQSMTFTRVHVSMPDFFVFLPLPSPPPLLSVSPCFSA